MSDSSPAEINVVEAPAETATTDTPDVTPAASSSAEKPATSMLDTVKAVLQPKEATPASSEPGETADAETPDSKTLEADPDELLPVELKALSERTQKRFKKLTSDLKSKDEAITGLKSKADEYDKIDTFIRNAGIPNEAVGNILQIAAMLNSDLHGARERLRPIMAELDKRLGEVLPSELQARVDQGYLTAEDAKALNRSAADAKLNRDRVEAMTRQATQDAQVAEQKRTTDATLSSIEKWELAKAAKDPDWHLKRDEVAEQVELAVQRKSLELKRPWFPNADEGVKLSEDALKTVEKRLKRFRTPLAEVRPAVDAGASTRSIPEPKSMLDVVRGGVSK